MNADVKEKWVAALRSGEYKQGTQALRRGDKYCCLGVLCDLHAQELMVEWTEEDSGTYRYLGNGMVPPVEVIEWAGLGDELPSVYIPDPDGDELVDEYDLASVNDESGYTFRQIADLIEGQL